ncbi:efflux transporter outer membrane subunit [Echinicola jeungdonensis]|uniref:Efflux transporter outer membrane subunit n=1 Tax=Echinicola jeungdonensis TaxID=709343 RepID=A0ABV5J6D2_9BACT|nr:efflux transporter outer membrane subunit [Echinicola jeungdonensis]MDN3669802.1 efflux transporter outer membrane subunit [Echinicola jeungdonensis]
MGYSFKTYNLKFALHGIAVMVIFGTLTLGCSPKVNQVEPPIENLENFSTTGVQVVPGQWWTSFKDAQLNAMIEKALQGNFELASTWEQYRAARAVVKRESSFLLPDLEATIQNAIRRPEPDFAGGENFQQGLSASYEVDLWGRIRAGLQVEKFRAEASLWDYQALSMTITAEMAINWYQWLAANHQLDLINQQIQTNENIIKLIKARFGSGQVRAVDILRQTQLMEATREQKLLIESQMASLENQLAVLIGQQPQKEWTFIPDSLPELPELPATGLPLELVRRRPDIQRAHHFLLAADRDMASAVTSRYPRLSFSLEGQVRSNNFRGLFQDWAYSLAGNLVAPLFYGGRLNAEVDRTEAVKQQRLYEYGQTVLLAFQEVEDALVQERKQLERLEVLKRQLDLANKTSEQLKISFLNGLSNYLDVLLALDQEQQLRREFIDGRLNLLIIRIGLYRALGGGFEAQRKIQQ